MKKERRHDLDWLRVIVFDLLIFFHVGMFFVSWDWHIKNNVIVEVIQAPMMMLNQWRLPILFVISGMGTRFALAHRTAGQFIYERLKRLLIPLVFGMLVIVPPQVYIERLTQGQSYAHFFDYYFWNNFKGIYPTGNFSWHHLWFLPYLLFFSLVLTPLFLWLRSNPNPAWLQKITGYLDRNPFGIYWITVPFMLIYYFLAPLFPVTHAFVGDWYTMAYFALFFASGYFLIHIQTTFWKLVERIWRVTFVMSLICFSIYLAMWDLWDAPFWAKAIMKPINIWSWIFTAFGLAAKYLNQPSELLSYRNQAVYPFYILHQTITVILGYFLMESNLAWGWKFLMMVMGTFLITWAIYEFLIRRVKFIWPLFGLKVRWSDLTAGTINPTMQQKNGSIQLETE